MGFGFLLVVAEVMAVIFTVIFLITKQKKDHYYNIVIMKKAQKVGGRRPHYLHLTQNATAGLLKATLWCFLLGVKWVCAEGKLSERRRRVCKMAPGGMIYFKRTC